MTTPQRDDARPRGRDVSAAPRALGDKGRVIGVGFPAGAPIPTNVSACGDGIHTAVMRWAARQDCVCDRFTIGPLNGPHFPGFARIVLLDAATNDIAVGEAQTRHGRLVRP